MKSKWALFVAGVALGLIALIWGGFKVFGPEQEDVLAARVDYLTGNLQIKRHDKILEFVGPLNNPLPLYVGDRVEQHPSAKMQITFKQGHQLEVSAGAVFVIARWNQMDPLSPFLLQVTGGNLKRVNLGEDRLFILRDGQLHSLESLNERALPELKIAVQTGGKVTEMGGSNVMPVDETKTAAGKTADAGESNDSTLSNSTIQQKLESQITMLLQCQKLIPDKPSGRIVVSFLIENNGKSKNLITTENTFKNKPVEQCVLSVIERITFSPFEGTPIQVTFPIAFE